MGKQPYLGEQYRGGRVKGKKNLDRIGDRYRNQYNVYFTLEEKKRLESLVNSANRKRKRMLEKEGDLNFLVAGKETGLKIKDVGGGVAGAKLHIAMGRESDFVLAKKSKSLQRFRSKKEYQKYISNLERVVDRDYIYKRAEQYRRNHLKSIKEMLGPAGKDIIEKLSSMSIKEYMKTAQQDEILDIGYMYLPIQKKHKAIQMKKALKMI